MFKAWFVVILLFLLSLCGFLGWYSDFATYYAYKNANVANATAASKDQKPGRVSDWSAHRFEYPVRFTTDSGRRIHAPAYAPRRAIDALQGGGTVKVFYLPDEPLRFRFEEDVQEMPRGWMSLLFGVVTLVVAIAALKIRSTLARHTKYLGRGGDSDDD